MSTMTIGRLSKAADGEGPADPVRRAGRALAAAGRLRRLDALRSELARMVAAGCTGLPPDRCVVETVADDGPCGRRHGASAPDDRGVGR